jgi:hypothetical protein
VTGEHIKAVLRFAASGAGGDDAKKYQDAQVAEAIAATGGPESG